VDFRRLGNLLMVLGGVVLLVAVGWWFSFYNSLARDVGRATGGGADTSIMDALTCLYSSGGICSVVTGVSSLVGKTPYEPMLFWFGLAGLVLGLLIRVAAKPAGSPR
jgi:hypothetical protein